MFIRSLLKASSADARYSTKYRRLRIHRAGRAQEEPIADAIAALQLILLALVAEFRDQRVIDPQMLAHRLKGTFPEDAGDSTVKGLVEVFGRRLEDARTSIPATGF